jgi:hypothetical protein
LRPVLVEIGASCPSPSLYLLDSDYETSPDLEKWLEVARSTRSRKVHVAAGVRRISRR